MKTVSLVCCGSYSNTHARGCRELVVETLRSELASVRARNETLEAALRLQPASHSFPDGKFCSDDCPACAKTAALSAVVPEPGRDEEGTL